MNYLRGALSAASQYYKELPPINPSTLTGAIDVIVVEKPAENGGTDLACSPFHVRFGKWQVLRPGEKKVTVLVNGHSIPFDMKIGDAGEAFFVFETDEDVPEDLITSPLLQATTVGESNNRTDRATERFGAKQDQKEIASQQPESQEPDFLDLNAPEPDAKTHPDMQDANPVITEPRATTLSPTPSGSDKESENGHSALNPALLVNKARQTGKAIVTAAEEDERTRFDALASKASAVRHLAASSISHMSGAAAGGPNGTHITDAGDDVLPPVDEEAAQPPKVTYHHDVVLDVSGYHSKEVSDQTIIGEDRHSSNHPIPNDIPLDSPITPEASRTPSPEPFGHPSNVRGGSEPPEYGLSSSPPPEYSWEWGAFPQRSPIRHNFSAEDSDMPRSISFPPQPLDMTVQERPPPPSRGRSPIPEAAFADGGKLEADSEDQSRIWLALEGQRFSFELSLCGDSVRGEEAIEDDRKFDKDRITFARLMEDVDVVNNRDLVVRWDDEYVSRQDNSPLMSALANWRRRTLSRPASPKADIKDGRSTQIPAPRPSTSTWSRWWSRNRTLPDAQETAPRKPVTPPPQDSEKSKRPSLEHAASAPVDPTPLGPQLTTGSQSSVVFPSMPDTGTRTKYAKTLRLTSDQLKALNLKKGANSITFSLSATGQVACTARIFLWDAMDHIVVSDIDGTITKSDALGHVFTMIGRDWTHLGVAKLYTDICRNGYKIMYLTSRAIGQADSTRDYLKGINQNNYQLPEGPVIMSPDRLLTSLHREVIMRKPELFKMACLRDIQRLFKSSSHNPFYAGFGNRITDALSYRSVNVPSGRIFTIDSSGEVKMELLELAGYKSSYIHMTDIVDQMFPPINRRWAPEYTDFNYWRAPIQEYDLPEVLSAPPSPTLSASARSDTSNQSALSRLRNFSLGRPSSKGTATGGTVSPTPSNHQNGHVRAVSLVDRPRSMLANEYFSDTPGLDEIKPGWDTDEDRLMEDSGRVERLAEKMSKPSSLPGSVEGGRSGMWDPRWLKDQEEDPELEDETEGNGGEDEEEDEEGEEDELEGGSDAEEAAEEAFDDDLLATGEMETVPFL